MVPKEIISALKAMFTIKQLEHWIALEWPEARDEVGQASAMSKTEYVFQICESLDNLGCITDDFFARWLVERPRRASEIEALRGLVHARKGPPRISASRAIVIVSIKGPDDTHRVDARLQLSARSEPCTVWDLTSASNASLPTTQAAKQVDLATDIVVLISARLIADPRWLADVLEPADQRRLSGECRLYPVRVSYTGLPPTLFKDCAILPPNRPLASMASRARREEFWSSFWDELFRT